MDRRDRVLIIPAVGEGRRFRDAGFAVPKPFIEIQGMTMLEIVIRNMRAALGKDMDVTVVLREDMGESPIGDPTVTVVKTKGLTGGAAETVKVALGHLHPRKQVVIANCDQVVDFDGPRFSSLLDSNDAALLTFEDPTMHPKWSYAALEGESDLISRVVEKVPISTHATVGIYGFVTAGRCASAIDKMIVAEDRHNGEFYLAPSFNYVSLKRALSVRRMWGLGTPEDLAKSSQDPDFVTMVEELKRLY